MKISKNQLKNLIKECLVEILAEGLGEELIETAQRPRPRRPGQEVVAHMNHSQKRSSGTPLLEQAISEGSGGDPVLKDILSDTAEKTLPQFLGNEAPVPPMSLSEGPVERAMRASEPSEVFDDSRWASLAFDAKSKSSMLPAPPPTEKIPDHILDRKVGGTNKSS